MNKNLITSAKDFIINGITESIRKKGISLNFDFQLGGDEKEEKISPRIAIGAKPIHDAVIPIPEIRYDNTNKEHPVEIITPIYIMTEEQRIIFLDELKK